MVEVEIEGIGVLRNEVRAALKRVLRVPRGVASAPPRLWTNCHEVDALPLQTRYDFADRLDRIGAGGG